MEKKIKKQDFDKLVRREILRGMKLGYTPDEVIDAIKRVTEQGFDMISEESPRIEEKKKAPHAVGKREYAKPTVAVIECSLEQSWDMCTVLREQLDYEFFPVVLNTMLTEGKKLLQYLGERTVYITTPFHYNDVHDILKEYGKDLRIMGGVDKMALGKGKKAIKAYLETLIPLVERGGYIPFCDHRCPPNVKPADYLYYLDLKEKMFGMS